MKTPIVIACDHAGYDTKVLVIKHLSEMGYQVLDLGTNSAESVDYPEYGHKLGEKMESGNFERGISICGSGNGINMVVNKHQGVRAAICWNVEISEMARRHNDANVCSIPARYVDINETIKIIDTFLTTGFDGGRHERRKNKIDP
ncbi:RpiB/LacA/LacB family sugar-phosphate isomerase [Bacteroidota bacterium]